MRKLMAYRESLTFRPVIGVDADIVFPTVAEGPAGLIRSQIALRAEHGLAFLKVSLDLNRYAGRVCLAHKLTRLQDRREFIHRISLPLGFVEFFPRVSGIQAEHFHDRKCPQRQ